MTRIRWPRRHRPVKQQAFPLLLVVSYGASSELAHTFIFSDPAHGTYANLRILDAFGSVIPVAEVIRG